MAAIPLKSVRVKGIRVDPVVLDKAIRCFTALSDAEKILILVAVVTGAVTLWAIAHSRGFTKGRLFEINFGQVPSLKLALDACNVARLELVAKMEGLHQHIRALTDQVGWQQNKATEIVTGSEVKLPPEIDTILGLRVKLTDENPFVWELREAQVPVDLNDRRHKSPLKIVTIANLKGGVGKTTTAANLAAYFDLTLRKRVLLIDLDYQGSLSSACLRTLGGRKLKQIESQKQLSDILIQGNLTPTDLIAEAEPLGYKLPKTKVLTASYPFAQIEETLLLRWLLRTTNTDIRYHVADTLWTSMISDNFDIVILDVGPRLTTASINALFASTHFIVPTNLDRLAVETLGSFLQTVRILKEKRNLPLEFAGVVGTMTQNSELNDDEKDAIRSVKDALKVWGDEVNMFTRTIPHSKPFARNGGQIGYVSAEYRDARQFQQIFNALGEEVAKRIGIEG